MNKVIAGFLICALTFLAFCLMFKDQIAEKIIVSECSEIDFYHFRLSLCDDNSREAMAAEKDSIAELISEYDDRLIALQNQNNQLKDELKKLKNQNNKIDIPKAILDTDIKVSKILDKGKIYQKSNLTEKRLLQR